jgi:fatty acid desaturase
VHQGLPEGAQAPHIQMIRYQFDEKVKNSIHLLYRYNNSAGILAVCVNFSLIAAVIALSEYSMWFLPVSILVIGSRQRALATLLHEASHGILSRSKRLNRFLGTWLSGYLVFQTWSAYKASHVHAHHSKLGNPAHDPDFQFYVKSGVYDIKTSEAFFWRHVARPILFLNFLSSVFYLARHRLLNKDSRSEIPSLMLAVTALGTVGTLCAGSKFFLLYWLLPYLTVFQAITWFIELSEHFPMVKYAKKDIEATRNRFSHAIEHFLTGMHGESFHLVHHLFPGVPFYRLKAAHRILLSDPVYAQLNANTGGIFLSSNFAPAVIPAILSAMSARQIEGTHA